jgi:hypothetical protein
MKMIVVWVEKRRTDRERDRERERGRGGDKGERCITEREAATFITESEREGEEEEEERERDSKSFDRLFSSIRFDRPCPSINRPGFQKKNLLHDPLISSITTILP